MSYHGVSYHIEVVNNVTGKRSRMTASPVTYREALIIMSKITLAKRCRWERVPA